MFGFKKKLYTPEYQLVGDECAVIETSKGTIKVKFDGEGAPIHVANFCELSTMGFYDGLKFHRYVPGFVIQGGDPNTRDMSAPTSLPVLRPRRHARYRWPRLLHQGRVCHQSAQQPCRCALAMARSMDPDSAVRSSTSAWVPSIISIPVTPSLVPRSRVSM